MSMITNDWLDEVQGEFKKPYYKELYQFVRDEYSKAVIYPPADDIFNAMHFTPLSKVKVLLLGQDPYHFPYYRSRKKYRLPYRISIRNCMMISAVISRIMDI